MVTSQDCIKKYGEPNPVFEGKFMTLWDVPKELEIGIIPKKIYCNKDLVLPLKQAFLNLIQRKKVDELKTWDGCFNIRLKRGLSTYSLHSWGIAIDVNASDNGLNLTYEQLLKNGKTPLTNEFIKCFIDAGFDSGANWTRPDRMHFQIAKI